MVTAASAGLPVTTLASRAIKASRAASNCPRGTSTRRIAVHFCPAFCVISRATSRTNAPNAALSGAASGASTAAFKLSASMLKRALTWSMWGRDRS